MMSRKYWRYWASGALAEQSRRITGLKLISPEELGRPRIDVTTRISGFFRDAFPHLIELMDEAVQMVIAAEEPLEDNFVRKHFLEEFAELQKRSGLVHRRG